MIISLRATSKSNKKQSSKRVHLLRDHTFQLSFSRDCDHMISMSLRHIMTTIGKGFIT
jgi:hypothetical protein